MKYLSILLIFFAVVSCKETNKDKEIQTEAQNIKTETMQLLVGTYTGEKSKGIYRVQFNPTTAALTNLELVAATESPSYLSSTKDGLHVFAVNETDPGSLSAFRWNDNRSQLELIAQQPSQGMHPCYIALHPKENLVVAANYSSGNIVAYQIDERANLVSPPQTRQHKGSGPVKPNQESPRAHFAAFNADGTYLYVVDLGIDQVLLYPVNENGILGDAQIALEMDKGDGPRHLVFHPEKDLVFVVNELSNSVISAKVDPLTGLMKRLDKKSTLPQGYSDKSFCADIHISKDGRFVYASNRGHNSIAIFKVLENGLVELLGTEQVQGEWPRNFTISPSGKHLLVANQNSNSITVFEVNPETGLLHFTGQQLKMEHPVCLQF